MTNYTNKIAAEGTLVSAKFTWFTANMRRRDKQPNGSFATSDTTIPTNCVRGSFTLAINGENMPFTVNIVEREPNFTNGVQQKVHPGYAQMKALEKLQPGTRIQVTGHLEDGTFAKNAQIVRGTKWAADYARPVADKQFEGCRAQISAIGTVDDEGQLQIYFAPTRGRTALPLFMRIRKAAKGTVNALCSGETVNLMIERHITTDVNDMGQRTYNRYMDILKCEVAEDVGNTYGFCRKADAEYSRNARAAYEQKLLDNEYNG